ncbi:MAG: glycosyltransferase family 2 protein, partial [Bacteroidia bacterium]|nr:glycosyltransferase family 2 protein [Bacteroidia bacterium]
MKNDITIIVPCYNEQEVLPQTLISLNKVSQTLKSRGYEVVLLFINDGSSDSTYDILYRNSKIYNEIQILSFSRNFGHQVAITAGINNCTTKYAAIIDADLQDPPYLIPDMLDTLIQEKAEVVYGQREIRKGESMLKKITAYLFYRVLNLMSDINI